MSHILTTFQLISGVAWMISSFWLWPNVRNTARGHASVYDLLATVLFFVALNQVGFVSRWYLFPQTFSNMGSIELLYWIGLYALSSILAVAVMLGGRFIR